ncbi:MAG: hypothetical protein J5850_02325 [Clostridia bacterium]|nr:hypothetical protein [Clostridia bacterium]
MKRIIISVIALMITVCLFSCSSAYSGPDDNNPETEKTVEITEETTIPPPMTRSADELEITLQIISVAKGFVIATDGEGYYKVNTSGFDLSYKRFASLKVVYNAESIYSTDEAYTDNVFTEEIILDYEISTPIKLSLLVE